MELVMRLPRGPRERVISQTTNPTAATSRPPLMRIRFLKPESEAVSSVALAMAAELVVMVTVGGLVAATITGAGATGATAIGSRARVVGAGVFWMLGAGVKSGLTGAGGLETGAGMAGGAVTSLGVTAGVSIAGALVAGWDAG